jgi:hypothetical protein
MLLHYERASLNTLDAANIVSPIVGVRAFLLRDESGVEGVVRITIPQHLKTALVFASRISGLLCYSITRFENEALKGQAE